MKFNDLCNYVMEANVYKDKETGLEKEFNVPYFIKGREMIMDPEIKARMAAISTMDRAFNLAALSKVLAIQARGISATPLVLQDIIKDIFDTQLRNSQEDFGGSEPLAVSDIKDIIINVLQKHNNISDDDAISKKSGVLNRAADRIFPWLSKQKFIRPITQIDVEEREMMTASAKRSKESAAMNSLSKHIEAGYDVAIKGQERENIDPEDVESVLGYMPKELGND